MPRILSRLIPLAIVTATVTPALAGPADDMQADIQAKSWLACLMHYKKALRAGAKDDDLKDLAAQCLAQAKADPDAKVAWASAASTSLGALRGEINDLKKGGSTDFKTLSKNVDACNDEVALAQQVVDPSTTITVNDYGETDWKGTLAEAQTWCDQGAKAVGDAKEKLLGPYQKAGIKADKLQLISDHLGVYFNVPGGETTSEPKKLAAASVLFLAWSGALTCTNGEPWRIERFQFDKSQKLVKTSSKEYCGDPPKSAYR